jgi:hypothetical protein
MGITFVFRFSSCLLAFGFSLPVSALSAPQLRASAAIELHLNAPADAAFPLFGPVRESEWAPDWSPKWIYPPEPRQSSEGSVFTTASPAGISTWVMTVYDAEKRNVEYVHLTPGHRVVEISITVRPTTRETSTARVSYRVTALSEQDAAFVAHFKTEFPSEAPHWERAVNAAISRTNSSPDSKNGVITVKPN